MPDEMEGPLFAALNNLLKAWRDPGVNPEYHYKKREQLYWEWPALYNALSELSEVAD